MSLYTRGGKIINFKGKLANGPGCCCTSTPPVGCCNGIAIPSTLYIHLHDLLGTNTVIPIFKRGNIWTSDTFPTWILQCIPGFQEKGWGAGFDIGAFGSALFFYNLLITCSPFELFGSLNNIFTGQAELTWEIAES